jgi:hypothetical protein
MLRRLVAITVLALGALAALELLRRRRAASRERVDLVYEDGSIVTLVDAEAQPLIDIARSALAAQRH